MIQSIWDMFSVLLGIPPSIEENHCQGLEQRKHSSIIEMGQRRKWLFWLMWGKRSHTANSFSGRKSDCVVNRWHSSHSQQREQHMWRLEHMKQIMPLGRIGLQSGNIFSHCSPFSKSETLLTLLISHLDELLVFCVFFRTVLRPGSLPWFSWDRATWICYMVPQCPGLPPITAFIILLFNGQFTCHLPLTRL